MECPNRVSFRVALPSSTRNSGLALPAVATKTLPTSLAPSLPEICNIPTRPPAHHIRRGCPFIPRTPCCADLIPASLLVFSLAFKRVQAAHLLLLLDRSEAREIGIFTTFQWRRRLTRRLRVAAAAAMTFRRVGGQMDEWLDGWTGGREGPFSNPLPPPPPPLSPPSMRTRANYHQGPAVDPSVQRLRDGKTR